jgi:hypothetical protein
MIGGGFRTLRIGVTATPMSFKSGDHMIASIFAQP